MTDFVRSGWQGQNLQESQASDNRNRLDACCKNIFAHQVKKPLQQPMTFTQSGWTDYGKETGVSVNSCIMFVIKICFPPGGRATAPTCEHLHCHHHWKTVI